MHGVIFLREHQVVEVVSIHLDRLKKLLNLQLKIVKK